MCSYNTYSAHYKEVECFQQQVETLLFQYGVSFVFNGHVHAYERSNPVFAYELNPCAPTYVVIGDGGNVEGVSAAWTMSSLQSQSLLKRMPAASSSWQHTMEGGAVF